MVSATETGPEVPQTAEARGDVAQDWYCYECKRIIPADQVALGKRHAGCGGDVEPGSTTAMSMTAPDPLEEAVSRLETLLDLNGHTSEGVRRAARDVIQAYLRAEADNPKYTFALQDTLRGMAHRMRAAETAEQERE